MRQREPDAQVRVQVQEVPGLVPQVPTSTPDRGDDHEQDQQSAGSRQEHAGVFPDEAPQLDERVDAGSHRVAHREQCDVRAHQPERPESDEAMQPRDPVATESALEQRDARHQQHLIEQQIRRDQPGEASERRDGLGVDSQDCGHSTTGDPQSDDEQAGRPDHRDRRCTPDPRAAMGCPPWLRGSGGDGSTRSRRQSGHRGIVLRRL